jgi:hypothetical protein
MGGRVRWCGNVNPMLIHSARRRSAPGDAHRHRELARYKGLIIQDGSNILPIAAREHQRHDGSGGIYDAR